MATKRDPEAILGGLEMFSKRLGLERIRATLTALGEPQLDLPTVLVAGTNGKGSTASTLAAIAKASGYRVGLFTSPHLEALEERISIDGVAIDREPLCDALEEIVDVSGRLGDTTTYFESMTVAAILHFVRSEVDVAVLEVGLGGRLDATNATEPLLSVISSIGHDHQEHLGPTLAEIAGEKAGILRALKPVVFWGEPAEVERALHARATKLDCSIHDARAQTHATELSVGPFEGVEATLRTPVAEYRLVSALPGAHQVQNLALSVRAAELLASESFPSVSKAAIEEGVRRCKWPGRLEWVQTPQVRVLLDCAHNLEAMAALRDALGGLGARCDVLFGSLRGKKVDLTLPRLASCTRRLTITAPPGERALPACEVRALAAEPFDDVHVEEDWRTALGNALEAASSGVLVVCGSLYLVGAVRGALRERYGAPAPWSDALF